jgi:hypothetical protein
MFTKQDLGALFEIQKSLKTIKQLMIDDINNPSRNALADVWNAFLDARACIIDKMLDDDIMKIAEFEGDLYTILQKRKFPPIKTD